MAITNTTANTALRYLGMNQSSAANSMAKLSSGSRIVKASDDAASLAIGTQIKADVTALRQAKVNTSNATSLLQVADGGLSQIGDILQRMKALSVQAQSGSVGDTERGYMQKEFNALSQQITSITTETKFGDTNLLDGTLAVSVDLSAATSMDDLATDGVEVEVNGAEADTWTVSYDELTGTLTVDNSTGNNTVSQSVILDNTDTSYTGTAEFNDIGFTLRFDNLDLSAALASGTVTVTNGSLDFQVGADSSATIAASVDDVRTSALGDGVNFVNAVDITSSANAVTAGDAIDGAIEMINSARADVGALISRFEFAGANLDTSIENLDAARSSLMDVDMAAEMSAFSAKNVQTQASVAMLAQANQLPQQLLRLLN